MLRVYMWFVRLLPPAIILLVIVLSCFARSFGSYFLADDFGHIAYISKIFEGDWQLLLSNFTGNFMQIPIANVYRPGLLISLCIDYGLWGTKAFGYYLTNILFMFGDALLLYAVIGQLTKQWNPGRSMSVSLTTAALFAASPLHSESVSFIAGRSDVICCFFYLASLWCFLKRGLRREYLLLISGIIFFWLAVLIKEMAICLPLLLAGIAILFPEQLSEKVPNGVLTSEERIHSSIKSKLLEAGTVSLPLWICLGIYFLVRYRALGTITGGYSGGFGATQAAQILEKWTDIDNLGRIIYPLNLEAFGRTSHYHDALTWVYFSLGALVVARFFNNGIPWRWLGFLALWLFTTLVPIYQLWGLGFNLEGARYLFFATMPIAALLPICLLSVDQRERPDDSELASAWVSLAVLVAFITVSTKIAYRNNIPWVHAGKETLACFREAQALAEHIETGKQVALIGLPAEKGGAHMILNGILFGAMMSPPFTKVLYADKFVTFLPIYYGNAQLLNAERLRRCLADPINCGLYVWDGDRLKFRQVNVPTASQSLLGKSSFDIIPWCYSPNVMPYTDERGAWSAGAGLIFIGRCPRGSGIIISPLQLNPFQFDYIEFELSRGNGGATLPASAYWAADIQQQAEWANAQEATQYPLPVCPDESFKKVRLPLSNNWRWFAGGNILQLRLELPPSPWLCLRNLRVISGKSVAPQISIPGVVPTNLGIYITNDGPVAVVADAKSILGCAAVELEISKANFFFDNTVDNVGDTAVLTRIAHLGNETVVNIANDVFPETAYYQIRARCRDSQGAPLGEKSDPVTIYVIAKKI